MIADLTRAERSVTYELALGLDGGASTLTQTSVGFGRSSFIALQDSVLQRTSSILQPFCNEDLLMADLSMM